MVRFKSRRKVPNKMGYLEGSACVGPFGRPTLFPPVPAHWYERGYLIEALLVELLRRKPVSYLNTLTGQGGARPRCGKPRSGAGRRRP